MGLVPEGKKQAHPRPATSCIPEVIRKFKALIRIQQLKELLH